MCGGTALYVNNIPLQIFRVAATILCWVRAGEARRVRRREGREVLLLVGDKRADGRVDGEGSARCQAETSSLVQFWWSSTMRRRRNEPRRDDGNGDVKSGVEARKPSSFGSMFFWCIAASRVM